MNSPLKFSWPSELIEYASRILLFDPFTQKVILVRDSKGSWRFASGRVETNESPEETAVREVMEETGIPPESYTLFPTPIRLIKPREPSARKIFCAKFTTLFPALLNVPFSEIHRAEHEIKSTPGWFAPSEAEIITRSGSRAASLRLAFHVVESLSPHVRPQT